MNQIEIKKMVESLAKEIESVTDDKIKASFKILFNLAEALVSKNEKLHAEAQQLRAMKNKLKTHK